MANILIADDSNTLRDQLKSDLEEAGHTVTGAQDGHEAVDKMSASDNFDLMIFDVNMPGLSGIEVLEKRKTAGLQSQAIVFMLTTDSTPELKQVAKELGVKAWITKPYQKDSLLNVIGKVFGS